MDNEQTPKEKSFTAKQLKEAAAVIVCATTVFAFLSVGFVIIAVKVIFGIDVNTPGEWSAAMLSLASTAIGFLAGAQQSRGSDQT